jgi:hypothetical protein
MRISRLSTMLIAALCALPPSSAPACSVPVFRYALERWEADAYPLVVFHSGSLSEAQRGLVSQVQRATANAQVSIVDVSKPLDREMAQLWQKHRTEKLPALILRYPESAAIAQPAWSGPLDAASVNMLLDSPLRQKVADRILKGECAVWVLLECGKADKDDGTARLLEAELERLSKTLKLPEPDDAVAEEILAAKNRPPLRIQFSLLRLSRRDATEAGLTSMLLNTEEDLKTYDEPMAFPVFGRGRALDALVGKGINAENIAHACAFITGACSCEVKRINPGKDLLFAVDWDRNTGAPPAREKVTDKTPGRRVKKAAMQPSITPASVKEETPTEDLQPMESGGSPLRFVFYGGIVVAVLLVFVALVRYVR